LLPYCALKNLNQPPLARRRESEPLCHHQRYERPVGSSLSIPVIDASALVTGDVGARETLVREFGEAYRTVGFSYIVNHGVDTGLISELFAASRRFHALPRVEKMAIELNAANRGFLPINSSMDVHTTLAEVTAPNQSESFIAMCEHSEDSPEVIAGDYLAGPNQWPALAGFASVVMEYHDAMCRLGRQMMGIAAEALGADPHPIVAHFASPMASARLLCYPQQPLDAPPGMFGSAPHLDFGCLTFLAQDDTGGLAVGTPSGEWIEVPPLDGAFVVNVGELLRRWSNGEFLSTPHRVINTSGRPRYSCPFFFDPHESTVITPLASCVRPDRPAAFDPVRCGDHLRSELEAGFDHHKKLAALPHTERP
jgi:isopenicillin N synthase-like dioxygenase